MNSDSLDIPALSKRFEGSHPQDILRWGVETFGQKLVVVTSFQPTGLVTLHMLHEMGYSQPILTLDTGLLFTETSSLVDQLEQQWDLKVTRVNPKQTVEQQNDTYGFELWDRDPDYCCYLRKVLPLSRALKGFRAWIAGVRRDQSQKRSETPILQQERRYNLVKLCPFANWTEDMIWGYIQAYDIPYNPLHDQNFPSIGCHTCTQPVDPTIDDIRAGRWAGRGKTECGINLNEPLNARN